MSLDYTAELKKMTQVQVKDQARQGSTDEDEKVEVKAKKQEDIKTPVIGGLFSHIVNPVEPKEVSGGLFGDLRTVDMTQPVSLLPTSNPGVPNLFGGDGLFALDNK